MLQQLLERIGMRQAERTKGAARTFSQLVRQVSDAVDEPDPEEIEAALDAIGRTAAELAEAVDVLQRRREWATDLEQVEQAEAEIATVRREAGKLDAALEAAVARHEQGMAALRVRESAASHAMQAGRQARNSLIQTADHSHAAQVEALHQQIHSATARRKAEAEVCERARLHCQELEMLAEKTVGASMYDTDLAKARERFGGYTAAVAQTDSELATLSDRVGEVHQAMLIP